MAGFLHRTYRHRADMACRWRFPQLVPDDCGCLGLKFSCSLGDIVLLSASLWFKTVPMLFITRPAFSNPMQPLIFASLEDDVVMERFVGKIEIDSLLNLMIYERWSAFVTALGPSDMTREMLFEVTRALEWNCEQAQELVDLHKRHLYLADVQAWKDLLGKLKLRMDIMATGI